MHQFAFFFLFRDVDVVSGQGVRENAILVVISFTASSIVEEIEQESTDVIIDAEQIVLCLHVQLNGSLLDCGKGLLEEEF